MTKLVRGATIGVALALMPGLAAAHVGITGLGGFWNGFLHPLLTPSHVLLLVSMGLLLGTREQHAASRALSVFLAATCAGLFVAGLKGRFVDLVTPLLVAAAVLGILAAWRPRLPDVLTFVIAAVCGLTLGVDSTQETYAGKDLIVALFATGLAVFLAMLYLLAAVEFLHRYRWLSVGVRVLGSWIAASALIVLTLQFAPKG
ncbi:MAG: HupE/UreJ family protein [Gammaproteobacteria bacterium]|nr:HupE/UreJ family protein [Gammaproteobacteria bacterium]